MKKVVIYILMAGAVLTACTKKENSAHDHAQEEAATKYTCSMHPQIIQDKPGTCPICGMNLVQITKSGNDNGDLMLSDTQIKLANIETEKVSMKQVGETMVVNARLTVDEQKTTVISSRVAGRIEKLHIKETGRVVKQGEPLYEIYSENLLTLQREYLLALDQSETLGKEEKRYQSFLKAAEGKLLLYGLSKNQIQKLAASKTLQQRVTFLAPAGGIVEEISAAEGQYLNEGDRLYRIENINNLWLEAELYPNEISYVKVGDKITVRIVGFESYDLTATVNFLSPEYRANSQITVMRATLNNPGLKFKPGMQAQVIFTHSLREAIAIPTDAIIREAKGTHVYVETDQNTFRPRMVKTGVEDFEQVEVISGLQEDEIVVVSGAYLLYSELILKRGVNPMAGHQHGDMQMTSQVSVTSQNEKKSESPFAPNPEFAKQLGAVLTPYLKVKDAFVASDHLAASLQIKDFDAALRKVNMSFLKGDAHIKWMANLKDMEEASKTIQSSQDIEAQRTSFYQLTNAFYTSIKTFGVEGLHAYYQYCPMAFDNKGAYWISVEKEISNPYFGEQMLRCGETKETLK